MPVSVIQPQSSKGLVYKYSYFEVKSPKTRTHWYLVKVLPYLIYYNRKPPIGGFSYLIFEIADKAGLYLVHLRLSTLDQFL